MNLESIEKEIIDNIIDSSSEFILNETVLNRSCDFKLGQNEDRTCSYIDEWFDNVLHHRLKKSMKDPSANNDLNDEVNCWNKELKEANESSP